MVLFGKKRKEEGNKNNAYQRVESREGLQLRTN